MEKTLLYRTLLRVPASFTRRAALSRMVGTDTLSAYHVKKTMLVVPESTYNAHKHNPSPRELLK